MCVQGKIVDVMCNSKMYNMLENVSVNDADNGKAEVISGQGQIRPSNQIRTQGSGTNKHNDVSKNLTKGGGGGVMLGQGHEPKVVVSGRVFLQPETNPCTD